MKITKIIASVFISLMLVSCGGKGGLSADMKKCIKNPECASSDGRLIIGFAIPEEQLDPHYRGKATWQAIYEGDIVPDEFYDH